MAYILIYNKILSLTWDLKKIATNFATKIMKGVVKRKNGYYYFRRSIPHDVKATNSAREFLVSLETKSETEAIIKADPLLKLSSYLIINARRENKKIMFRQTSTKATDLCLNFMASVVIGDMKMTFEGETNEVIKAVKELKNQSKHETDKIETFDSEFILSRKSDYISYLKKQKYSPQTIRSIESAFNEFSLIMKNQRISELNKKTTRQIIKVLFALPPNYDHDKTIQDVLHEGKPARSYQTSKLNVSRLKQYFSFLVQLDLLESNPITSDLIPPAPRKLTSNNFANFTHEDLKKIFSNKLILKSKKHAYYYWSAVLALYTGARVAEILQLRLTDVVFDHKVPYLNIDNADDKLVKNKSSIRKIPIHPTIIKLGFKEFYEQVKSEKYEILFPDNSALYLKAPAGNISKWFGGFLTKLGIQSDGERRKVFHSFRHTFITELQRIGCPLEIRQSIAGHTSGVITIDVYGEKTQLEKMYEWIRRIDFNIDIPVLENTAFHKRKRKEIFSKRK